MLKVAVFPLALFLVAGNSLSSHAADTTECYALGPTDFEFYINIDGLSRPASEQTIGNQIVLGYGITPRLSGYLGTVLSADGNLLNSSSEIATGLFGTPWDSAHLDLDIFLGFNHNHAGDFTISPGLELNWDAAPNLAAWGLYTRSGMTFSGSSSLDGNSKTSKLLLALGGYWTIVPGHQLLIEFDGELQSNAANPSHLRNNDKEWTTGGVAIGYNAFLQESLELISHIYIDIPEDNEDLSFGWMFGFITTM